MAAQEAQRTLPLLVSMVMTVTGVTGSGGLVVGDTGRHCVQGRSVHS